MKFGQPLAKLQKIFSGLPKPALFALVFALVGLAALLLTQAATPATYFEAEDATITSPAQKVTDVTASNSTAIQFGSAQASNVAHSEAFIDSIGVNIHISYYDTAYTNFAQMKAKLGEAGIKHVRDNALATQPEIIDRMRELHTDLGVKTTLLAPNPRHPDARLVNWIPLLESKNAQEILAGIEGTNEFDGVSGRSPGWVEELANHQVDLYQRVKASTKLRNLPVLAPSLIWELDPSVTWIAGSSCDYANQHSYTGGVQPSTAHLHAEEAKNNKVCPGKPNQATETGYHTLYTSTNNQPGVPEDIAGKYIPRQFLENFKFGIKRTFAYEFVDSVDANDAEGNFGLLRRDYTHKPAYNQLKTLIALLKDPGTAYTPQNLSVNISGSNTKTRSVLFGKRDGSYWLAVWQEDSIYNHRDNSPPNTVLNPAPLPVTVNVGQTFTSIKRYQVDQGTTSLQTASNTQSLPVSSRADSVTIIQFQP